jgi:hypothetical protein
MILIQMQYYSISKQQTTINIVRNTRYFTKSNMLHNQDFTHFLYNV